MTAAAGTACLVAPDENSFGSRLLRALAALCVLSVALSPVWTARERIEALFSSFEDFINTGADGGDRPQTRARDAVAAALASEIKNRVCGKYSLDSGRVKVAVTVDDSDASSPVLVSARVSIVGGDGTPGPDEVEEFLCELTGVSCTVVIIAPG